MYNASSDQTDILDIKKTAAFIEKWDWDLINQVGFYGGEPSINLPLYQNFMDLIPKSVSKFIITNGTWSTNYVKMMKFLNFFCKNSLYVIISGTDEHKPYQNLDVLKIIKHQFPEQVRLKEGDVIHPMGRAKHIKSVCGSYCQEDVRNLRLAIHPSGNILFQNCHGDYPIVQTIDDPFDGIHIRAREAALQCSIQKRRSYETLLSF